MIGSSAARVSANNAPPRATMRSAVFTRPRSALRHRKKLSANVRTQAGEGPATAGSSWRWPL